MFTFFYFDSECFAKYDAFCWHVFDYVCLRRRPKANIAIEEVRNYGKFVYIKSIFENGWWEGFAKRGRGHVTMPPEVRYCKPNKMCIVSCPFFDVQLTEELYQTRMWIL